MAATRQGLLFVDPDGSNAELKPVGGRLRYVDNARWSADGRRPAIELPPRHVYVANADGSDLALPREGHRPNWSPP